ncbi:FecR family protein [Chitinophaga nivalis]|uniref:FecR domain-containing protein n=1 Tax=Chitinophaga nivalis TaxID=2991709 RepID=A0ABT3IJJ4_9BACT|nr:FecR family protein [Chitinophaga nivalis]MCW3466385.1 FecR domain-containing protein [Chitinophaga nivalis]MCW3483924.1 FecR domain-containing protein [Chitinophaga nivalis]
MNRHQLSALLERFLQQEASPHEKKMVEAYMLLSEKEATDFSDEEKTETKARIWSSIDQQAGGSGSFRSHPAFYARRSWWLRVAAIWIFIAGTTIAGFLLRDDILDQLSPIAWKEETTGPYEIKRIVLPDSSMVNLAPNSAISFPSRYRGHVRQTRLSGMAFFNVAPDVKRPFVVASGQLDIKVLGTSFEVRNVPSQQRIGVTVATGKVQVQCAGYSPAILTANQEARYNNVSGLLEVREYVDAAAATAWHKNVLIFHDTPLEVVLKTLQAHYNMKMTIGVNAIKKAATFSGAFNGNESQKEILDVICFSSGLKYTVTRDSTVVIKK